MKRFLSLLALLVAGAVGELVAQVPQGPVAAPMICSRGDSITNTATTAVDTLFGPGSVGTGSCGLFASTLNKPASATFSTGVWIWVSGHATNNADAKTVRVQIGGVVADSLIITASTANKFVFICFITVRSAASGASLQPSYCYGHQGDGTPTTVTGPALLSFDPTIVQQVMVTISQAGATDIVLDQILVGQYQ